MPTHLPSISIIIPTFNEAGFIADCIKSLTQGSYPLNKIEILVVDGGSDDDTVNQVRGLSKAPLDITVLNNHKKITPAAMNIGIKAAKHELLMWCGAHAIYNENYVINSVKTLLSEPSLASVGGVISPIAKTTTGKAIAIATSNKFGIGNAQYRYATKRQYVDTVFGGCFFKKHLIQVGGFNEAWVRNQDYELNHRLRSQIGPIVLEPSIRCQYFCRESISRLSKQYFNYGFWRFNTLLKHPSSFTSRQVAPVLLCVSLVASITLITLGHVIGWFIPLIYSSACLAVSIRLALDKKQAHLLIYLPIIFAALHISWGTGFIKNAIQTTISNVFKSKH
jgi:succinoglycan biosynthesis protein ExoA